MKSLTERYNELSIDAIDQLEKLVQGEIVLTEDADNDIYDLPYCYHVGKYNAFAEYGITKVYRNANGGDQV